MPTSSKQNPQKCQLMLNYLMIRYYYHYEPWIETNTIWDVMCAGCERGILGMYSKILFSNHSPSFISFMISLL